MVANFLTVVSAAWTRVGVWMRECVRATARVALPRLELAICAVVKDRCERTLPQVAPDETGREDGAHGGGGDDQRGLISRQPSVQIVVCSNARICAPASQ